MADAKPAIDDAKMAADEVRFQPYANSGMAMAAIGTDTSKVKIALESLNREWSMLVKDGITEAELKDARINMKNSMIYRIDRKSNRANNMAYYEFVGYNYCYAFDLIEMADRVKLADVNQFIKREFTEDRKFVSIVGKN